MPEPLDLMMLDRLEKALRENKKRTQEQGVKKIWLPVKTRLHEYDQMLELVTQFKATFIPKP